MKTATAEDLFPDFPADSLEYQPILDAFGEIVIQVDDDSYQGDSRVFYKDGDKFGHLIFGWGSCSGCDELYACASVEDIQLLINHLHESIVWFESASAALEYFKTHDWDGDFSNSPMTLNYRRKVIQYLEEKEE